MVPDTAIVRDVAIGEEVVAAADDRFRMRSGAAIDRDEFAKCVSVADFQVGRLAVVFQVLRALADAREREELVCLSDDAGAVQRDVVLEPASITENYAVSHDAVGSDFAAGTNLGFWRNYRGWMNAHFRSGNRGQNYGGIAQPLFLKNAPIGSSAARSNRFRLPPVVRVRIQRACKQSSSVIKIRTWIPSALPSATPN